MAQKKIKLNFHANSAGTHDQAWREPWGARDGEFGIGYYQELARIAERGLFDGFFLADTVGLYGGRRRQPVFDPLVILAALATVTERIGLVGSASTTFSEPYNVARQYSTLDHVSRGRAGWNVVTTYNENAAANFGLASLPEKTTRYARAEEFVDVVRKLWQSWDYDSLHQPSGFKDGRALTSPAPINHDGAFYKVGGPLQLPRTPQGSPVIFQAGGSPEGRALAARTAEGVFAMSQTLAEAQEFYEDIKARARAFGRREEDVVILPGIYVYIGSTEKEVAEIRESLFSALTPEQHHQELASSLFVTVADLPLDKPIPEEVLEHALLTSKRSTIKSMVATAREGRPTVAEILAQRPLPQGHRVLIDLPERIADNLEEWFVNRAADGFNIGNLTPPKLGEFVDTVVPILQKRGLYRTEYQGETLRSHYREDFENTRKPKSCVNAYLEGAA
jgi:FMN-dependent oxidoreductase (nitrilotriacetate monooxygenase family)